MANLDRPSRFGIVVDLLIKALDEFPSKRGTFLRRKLKHLDEPLLRVHSKENNRQRARQVHRGTRCVQRAVATDSPTAPIGRVALTSCRARAYGLIMSHRAPVKIESRYPTVSEVARMYGVSPRRVARVVALVDSFLHEQKVSKRCVQKVACRREELT